MSAAEDTPADTGPKPSKLPMLMALANTVAIMAALGLFVQTRLLYKRPPITEARERERIALQHAQAKPADTKSGLVVFEPFTVNILSSPVVGQPGSETQLQSKPHFASIGFALELRDMAKQSAVEGFRPQLMDHILSLMGRKDYHEVTTVQGRYLLRTQIIDMINDWATKEAKMRDPLVTNVFFTQFQVQ